MYVQNFVYVVVEWPQGVNVRSYTFLQNLFDAQNAKKDTRSV